MATRIGKSGSGSVHVAGSGLEVFARSGYAARGLVYIIIGWFALLAATGSGGKTTDSQGALLELLSQPFGDVLLGVVALGLLGYAAWRTVQAIKDTDRHGSNAKGLAVRAGLVVSAITHTLLAVFAFSLIFGLGSGGGQGGDDGTREWTAWLMQQPFGRWLVAAIGTAVIGAGFAHIWKGWRAEFEKYLEMDQRLMQQASPICRFGLIARGVVFLIVGAFFVVAAWRASSGEARGLAGALQALQDQPYGWLLLGIVAAGLIAFGFYSLIEALFRRIERPG